MWNVVSLDGYFDGPNGAWDLDFHQTAWGDELEAFSIEQLGRAGGLIFGRVTYEGMAAYWPTADGEGEVTALMNSISKYVFSRTLDKAEWNNTRLLRAEAADEVVRLKQEPGNDLYVFGSGILCSSLMAAGLFDEMNLCIAPTILGNGTTLFKSGVPRESLQLLEARPLRTGAVLLRYGKS
jgi:dihydrofolate reductase